MKALDGPSSSVSHVSKKFKNPWNNLLYERDALEFINDSEAVDCGLGYEECNNIMNHKKEAYDENDFPGRTYRPLKSCTTDLSADGAFACLRLMAQYTTCGVLKAWPLDSNRVKSF